MDGAYADAHSHHGFHVRGADLEHHRRGKRHHRHAHGIGLAQGRAGSALPGASNAGGRNGGNRWQCAGIHADGRAHEEPVLQLVQPAALRCHLGLECVPYHHRCAVGPADRNHLPGAASQAALHAAAVPSARDRERQRQARGYPSGKAALPRSLPPARVPAEPGQLRHPVLRHRLRQHATSVRPLRDAHHDALCRIACRRCAGTAPVHAEGAVGDKRHRFRTCGMGGGTGDEQRAQHRRLGNDAYPAYRLAGEGEEHRCRREPRQHQTEQQGCDCAG